MNLNTGGWASRAALSIVTRLFSTGTNATRPVVAVLPPEDRETILRTNLDVALVAKGFGATIAQVPDETTTGGNLRGQRSTDFQKNRGTAAQVASGTTSGILAGVSNQASGVSSVVVGGDSNTASSNYSFVGGGQSNIAQTSTHATVCGGNGNTASGQYSFIGGGNTNTASATRSCIVGGDENLANAAYCFIAGGKLGTARSIQGYHVFPAIVDAITGGSYYGKTQAALLLVARETTDATATVLTSNSSAAAATNQVTLPNNSAYSFSGEVIAGVTAAGDSARWTIDGAIKRGANAASTAMVGTPTVVMTHFDAGAATWVVAVTANATLGCITVTVTGAAATTIRWVCKINTTEMTY